MKNTILVENACISDRNIKKSIADINDFYDRINQKLIVSGEIDIYDKKAREAIMSINNY